MNQKVLIALHDQWEPECSAKQPEFREATCAGCGRKVRKMWHVWLNHRSGITRRKVTKEIHLCRRCGAKHGLKA